MIRRVLISTIVALSACQQPAKSCAANADCPAGSQCVESLCVQGSGSAGGSVGGGAAGGQVVAGGAAGSMGGGMVAGGAGGSTVAGGMAGGAAGGMAGGTAGGMSGGTTGGGGPICNCMPWQTCNQSAGCDNGTLTVISPQDGFEVAPDGSIPLQAVMLQFDGGTWTGAAIPVSSSLNLMGTLQSGVPDSTPAGTQTQFLTIRFGWSGLQVSRTVSVVDCAKRRASLQPYEECVPTIDGGAAYNAGYIVEWVSPDAGSRFNSSMVAAQVRVRKPDGGAVLPVLVPVVPPASLTGTGGVGVGGALYSGALPLSGLDGPRTFVAGWPDGGPEAIASLTLERDTSPPTVTLTAMPRSTALPPADPLLSTAWVKDEVAHVSLTVTGATRAPTAGDVAGVGFNALPSEAPGNCGVCVAPDCICVAVDLKDAPLDSLRGDAGFTVDAGAFVDSAGNRSSIQNAQMGVTRVKWLRLLARPTGSLFVAAPAVDSQGNLYVGTSNNIDNLGSLVSLHPVDGGIRWQNSSLGAIQAFATANSMTQTAGAQDLAYVASNEDTSGTKTGRLRAVRADNGGVAGLSASICLDAARPMFSAPALVVVAAGSSPQVGALGIFNSVTSPTAVSGEGCIYRPANGAQTSAQKPEFVLPEVPTPASSVVNIASTGSTHYSVNSDFSIESWTWGTTALVANGGLGRTSGPTQTGLVALGGGLGSYPLLTTQISSTPLSVIGAGLMNPASIGASGFTRASPAVVLPGTGSSVFVLTGGDDSGAGGWLRLSQLSLSAASAPMFMGSPQAVSSLPAGIESLPTSPIYGDANQVYVVTRGGRLYVLNATTSGLTFAWSAQLTSQGDVLAHPTLDCNRSRPGAPGVLYSISSQGTVSAVVVDSRRLGPSVWPKWQRTAGNAGSVGAQPTDFPLNPGCN